MNDPIRSATTEGLLGMLLFEVGNSLPASVTCVERAKEKLDSSHPAFSDLTMALQAAERAQVLVRMVGDEWLRRKNASTADQ